MGQDVRIGTAHGFFEAHFAGARAHRGKGAVPDAEAAQHQRRGDAQPEQGLHPHEGGLDAFKLLFLGADDQIGRGLMLAHHFRDQADQGRHVFPADGAHKQARHLAVAPVAVDHGGVGQKTALAPTAQHHAADHAHHLKNVLSQKQQFAHGLVRVAVEIAGGFAAQHADPAVALHICIAEQPPGREGQGINLGEILVDADEIDAQRTFALAAQEEALAVPHIAADHAHARQSAQGVHGGGKEFAHGLTGVLLVIHIDLDDVDPAHEHHILPHFIPDFAAQHGKGNKGGDAQSNGQNHPEAALAHNLPEADAKKIGHGDHSVTTTYP